MPDPEITNALTTHSPDPRFVADTREMLSAAWANPTPGAEQAPIENAAPLEPLTPHAPARPMRRRPPANPSKQAWIVPTAAAAVLVLGGIGLYPLMRNSPDQEGDLVIGPAPTVAATDAVPTTTTEPETAAATAGTTVSTTAVPTTAATTAAPTTAAPTTAAPTTAAPTTAAPTTAATTAAPTTAAPTTAAPTTAAPTTAPPSTAAPSTVPPTTVKPDDPFAGYTAAPIPEWAKVSATAPVAKFPADGVYASGQAEVNGNKVTFLLEQRFLGQACWDHFANDPDAKSICASNDGNLADGQVAEPSATITADAKANVVATFLVPPSDDQVATYAISFDEFIRGIQGDTIGAMAPRDMWLRVQDGRVVSILSMEQASRQLAPYLS